MLGMGSLGNLANILKGAQELQKKMAEIQEQLAKERVEGSSGGGMVKVVANVRSEILAIEIEPALMNAAERDMLQELIVAATNQALMRAKERMQEEMAKLFGGLPLPPGMLNMPGITGG